MAVDIITETVIDRPLAAVAAYAGDPDKGRRSESGLGSRSSRTSFGRRLAYTYEIIDLVPGSDARQK